MISPNDKNGLNKRLLDRVYWRSSYFPKVECVDTKFTSIPQDMPEDVQTVILYGNRISTFKIKELKKYQKLKSLFLKGRIEKSTLYLL